MKKYRIRKISQIPFEGTHALPNTRQTLASKDDVVTDNIDALTKGVLPAGKVWDWHKHEEYDELCIVLKGRGSFFGKMKLGDMKKKILLLSLQTVCIKLKRVVVRQVNFIL